MPEQEILIAFAEHASLALIDAASVQAMNDALRAAVHDAMHDQLTGLPNRACFYERTEQALAVAGELKIDKTFVLHMHRDPNDAIIVRSVIDLARNLGLRTVAEGVEDLDTWAQLAALGCSAAQGFVLARPIAAEALGSWMLDDAAPGGCFSSPAPAPADR